MGLSGEKGPLGEEIKGKKKKKVVAVYLTHLTLPTKPYV